MDAQVHSSPLNTPSIISIAEECRSQLRACTLSSKLVKSQWAYDRLSDFDLWDTSVGASAEGSGSLDFRLAEDQTSRKVVIVSLNTLKAWINLCRMLAGDTNAQAMGPNGGLPAIEASSEIMDESNATKPDGITLEEAKSGVEELQTLLGTLGVAVRHAGVTSHLNNNAQSAVENETSRTNSNVPEPSERPEKASSVLNHSLHESTTVIGLQNQSIPVQANSTIQNIRTNPVGADNRPRSTVYSGSSGRVRLSYMFRINELRESGAMLPAQDANGQWEPTDMPGANIIVAAGATGIIWLCNGWQIKRLDDNKLLRHAKPYKTYSAYYCHGKGFQILRDNAVTNPRKEEGWLPLSFEHDKTDYSSYLTNARYEPSLHCHRSDQRWMEMLLPDVYHDRWEVPAPYGGLKGELAIFLALLAFSLPVDSLQHYLPSMFQSGEWQQYDMENGRDHKRGVVVEIWTYSTRHGGSSSDQLAEYEENGKFYA